MSDRPLKPTAVLTELELEAASPEPFVLALPDSSRITFPDLYDIPAEDGEKFMQDMESAGENDFEFLEKWLTKEDFEKYKGLKLKLRTHALLMNQVLSYYRASLGRPGEGRASKG